MFVFGFCLRAATIVLNAAFYCVSSPPAIRRSITNAVWVPMVTGCVMAQIVHYCQQRTLARETAMIAAEWWKITPDKYSGGDLYGRFSAPGDEGYKVNFLISIDVGAIPRSKTRTGMAEENTM